MQIVSAVRRASGTIIVTDAEGRTAAVSPGASGEAAMALEEWMQTHAVVDEADTPDGIAAARATRIAAAWDEMGRRLSLASVAVATSAGSHAYGLDEVTQSNIAKAALGVALGITPDPRPWTPKGATAPVMLSHADLTAVAAAVGAAYDAMVQAYLLHKAAIKALGSSSAVAAYDIGAGWPY